MDDAQIIELYWQRDERAVSESRAKYGGLLMRIAVNILQNAEDGEDCVSDTYVRAWDTMPPQRPSSLAAYLGRITRNLSINRWHAARTQKRGGGAELLLSELEECAPARATVEQELERSELTSAIDRWLRSLPRTERALFLRRYWYGDGVSALAEECGVTPRALAGRLYRLRQKLRRALEKEEIFI
ncbi:MAG: RNA polymerase sigma factor [Clostridia bacterium]|nr:RNA polymerase sigma factor [Clostridia bacterium]